MMDLLITLGGLVVLVLGAEAMVRGAVDLALRARISPLVIGSRWSPWEPQRPS